MYKLSPEIYKLRQLPITDLGLGPPMEARGPQTSPRHNITYFIVHFIQPLLRHRKLCLTYVYKMLSNTISGINDTVEKDITCLQDRLQADMTCPIRSRIRLHFASTWVHARFLAGFVLHSCLVFCVVLRCVFICLRLVCLMLPVSLDYPSLIVPSVFSNVYVFQTTESKI